jgi:hypothetical protein
MSRHERRLARSIMRGRVFRTVAVGSLVAGVGTAVAARPAPAQLAGCTIHTVVRGDTAWSVFAGNLSDAPRLNPHISDLGRIFVGDQLVTECAAQPQLDALTVPDVGLVDVASWLDEREPDGRLTWRAFAAHLYQAGFRGNDIVTMGGIVAGESALNPDAVGDITIQDAKWSASHGLFQIRTLKAQKGTGSWRDEDVVSTVDGNVRAAFELVRSRRERKQVGFEDWTGWLLRNGQFASSFATGCTAATAAGQQIGVL